MITRQQYLDFKGDSNERASMHQAFYAQFANANVISAVAGKFSPQELVDAYKADRRLNNIDLRLWDDLARYVYPWIDRQLVKSTNQIWSLSSGVCTCKAAAIILISRALGEPVV